MFKVGTVVNGSVVGYVGGALVPNNTSETSWQFFLARRGSKPSQVVFESIWQLSVLYVIFLLLIIVALQTVGLRPPLISAFDEFFTLLTVLSITLVLSILLLLLSPVCPAPIPAFDRIPEIVTLHLTAVVLSIDPWYSI